MPPKVDVWGLGQYAERMIGLVGSMEIQILGVLVTEKEKKVFRGFPVYLGEEAPQKETPVLLSVSRYKAKEYENMLKEAGFHMIIRMNF